MIRFSRREFMGLSRGEMRNPQQLLDWGMRIYIGVNK